jgi:protein-disulfide isomerase
MTINNSNPFDDSRPSLSQSLKQNWKTIATAVAILVIGVGGFFFVQSTVRKSSGLDNYVRAENLIRKTNYTFGKKDSSLQFVYAFDYLCPACQGNQANMKQIVDKNKDSVNFVFKHFIVHSGTGDLAAQAAQAAGRQGKYYEYYEELMTLINANSGASSNSVLEQAAKQAGLDVDKWNKDRTSVEIEQEIAFDQRDIREANFSKPSPNGDRKPTGTPSVILVKNGEVADWWTGIRSVDDINATIEKFL